MAGGNKGNALIAAISIAAVLVGLLLAGWHPGAEAVIGEQGNLSSESGHKHNFSAGSGGVEAQDETRICVFCHTPHNAITGDSGASLINAPLWNHTLSDPSLTYDVKTQSSTYTNTITGDVYLHSQPLDQPDGASRLCLSCHDGTVSVGNVRSITGGIAMVTGGCLDTDGSIANTCSSFIGTVLTGKHVVSVPMNGSLLTDSAGDCGGSITTKLDYPWKTGYGSTVILRPTLATYGGNPGVTNSTGKYKSGYTYGVQCSTCHDPHYWKADADSDGQADAEGEYFVVTDTSSLCSACHISC